MTNWQRLVNESKLGQLDWFTQWLQQNPPPELPAQIPPIQLPVWFQGPVWPSQQRSGFNLSNWLERNAPWILAGALGLFVIALVTR